LHPSHTAVPVAKSTRHVCPAGQVVFTQGETKNK